MTVLVSEEWLWGWDPTPGIVSVWADGDGETVVWRRLTDDALVCETARFRPWLLIDSIDHLTDTDVTWRELDGPGALRFYVSADSGKALTSAVLKATSTRLGRRVEHISEFDKSSILSLPPEEQYLVASGRAYFRDLTFDQLHRLQFDLETTGLDSRRDRIFMVAVRDPAGVVEILEAQTADDAGGVPHGNHEDAIAP